MSPDEVERDGWPTLSGRCGSLAPPTPTSNLWPTVTERDRVLVVDDDPKLLRAAHHVLQFQFDVRTATSASEALTCLGDEPVYAAIVTDMRMPEMDGLELMRRARRVVPDTVRVLVSGCVRAEDALVAVNECGVFRLLGKPLDGRALGAAVADACAEHQRIVAERNSLERTLRGSLDALSEVFALVQPAAFGRAMRLRRHARELAEQAGVMRVWDIEVAALLSQLGAVNLAPGVLDRWYHGLPLQPEERDQIERLPSMTEAIIARIPGLEAVRSILRRQHEPTRDDHPIATRILAIASDFDLLIGQGETADLALDTMEGRTHAYDPALLAAFRAIRSSEAPTRAVREMCLLDVQVGMLFATDVTRPNGVLLVARGQQVTESLRHRVRNQWCEFATSLAVRMIVPDTHATADANCPAA